jgi:3-deoxy-D-manno-octulosonic-acid transferase
VLLLDTLGELESVYSFSTASFLGGTIRDIGGHNPLEAAMYGVFLCAGNSRWNIKEIANGLALVGAMVDVSTQRDASAFIANIAAAPQEARLKGERGRAIVEQSRGATKRIISALQNVGVLPR